MEEKERYEYFFGTNTIKDNKTNQFYGCVVDLLNQQDKELSKLRASYQQVKEENSQLKQQLAITEKALELACEEELREFGVYTEDYGSEQKLFQLIEDYKQQAKEMLENE